MAVNIGEHILIDIVVPCPCADKFTSNMCKFWPCIVDGGCHTILNNPMNKNRAPKEENIR